MMINIDFLLVVSQKYQIPKFHLNKKCIFFVSIKLISVHARSNYMVVRHPKIVWMHFIIAEQQKLIKRTLK